MIALTTNSAVIATPWMWLYVCARSSSAFFVAAYSEAGVSVTSSSEKGTCRMDDAERRDSIGRR